MSSVLDSELVLPCGAVIPNRIAKAAMTEGLAKPFGEPTEELERLYSTWSHGGAGLLISGNIIVDQDHLERPGNVVIDREPDTAFMQSLTKWASAATENGNHFWAQISHAGRQTQKNVNPNPKAPSAVKVNLPGNQFGPPQALQESEITELINSFVRAACIVKEAGFTGVQIHAAHGYLISQFLSPLSNLRNDQWGGELSNRARLLLEIVKQVRTKVGADFPIAVKLNSADFQKGGFSFDESLQVAQWLQNAGIDLIEISGGNYEQPKLLGIEGAESAASQSIKESTAAREAYFIDFAKAMQQVISIPLMITGGIRQRMIMEKIIEDGDASLIGIARPMCVMTDAPNQLFNGIDELPKAEQELSLLPNWLSFISAIPLFKLLNAFGIQYWYYAQIDAVGRTGNTDPQISVFRSSVNVFKQQKMIIKMRQANE